MVVPLFLTDARVWGCRLERLDLSPLGVRVLNETIDANDVTLGQLAALAEINQRRAESGFRVTVVVNVSAPIAYVAAIAQLFPSQFATMMGKLASDGLLGPVEVALAVTVALSMVYSFFRSRESVTAASKLSIRSCLVRKGRSRTVTSDKSFSLMPWLP